MDFDDCSSWGSSSRAAWSGRRRRAAGALLVAILTIGGVAIGVTLSSETVPDNALQGALAFAFEVDVLRPAANGGTPVWQPAGPPPMQPIFAPTSSSGAPTQAFPGVPRSETVRLVNTNVEPRNDASFRMYIGSIEVHDCRINADQPGRCGESDLVAPSDPRRERFVNLWTLKVDREGVARPGGDLNENDHGLKEGAAATPDHDDSTSLERSTACEAAVSDIVAGAPCALGLVRAAGSKDALGQPTDTGWYTFAATESDPGSGASSNPFAGWTITFSFVFLADVPAQAGA